MEFISPAERILREKRGESSLKIGNEVQRRRNWAIDDWWNGLSKDRLEKYEKIEMMGSDSKEDLKSHLWECRRLLSLSKKLVDEKDNSICEVKGVAIHGVVPVVLIQIRGMETSAGSNLNEIREFRGKGEPHLREMKFKASFDTTPFKVKAKKPDILPKTKSHDWVLDIESKDLE